MSRFVQKTINGISAPEDFAEDLAELVGHLGYDKVPVAGISLGGMVVQQLVLDHPDLVSGAILIDTTPRITDHIVDMVYGWREIQVREGDEAYWWTSTRDTLSEEFINSNSNILDHLRDKFLSGQTEANVMSALGFAAFDVVDRLGQIEMPVLIVHGANDRLFLPEMAELFHENITGSRLELIGSCGHSPDVEKPQVLANLIIQFLNQEQ